jgi:hypothetical protein
LIKNPASITKAVQIFSGWAKWQKDE